METGDSQALPEGSSAVAGGDTSRVALPAVRLFSIALGLLLVGYMFLGRGFAHVGLPPLYVGEIVLAVGILATASAVWRNGVRAAPSRVVWLLLGLMVLGAARTVPYLGSYGLDALRDATLWGYAAFTLMVFALADRDLLLKAFRLYGWVVPVFAIWLPISYYVFAYLSDGIDPHSPGSFVPLVFFKGGDMAVHIVGVIAFLVLGTGSVLSRSSIIRRVIIGVPLLLTAFIAGAANRGALLTLAVGVAVVASLAPRSRNWLPLLLAALVLIAGLTVQGSLLGAGPAPSIPLSSASPTASGSAALSPTSQSGSTESGSPGVTPSSGTETPSAPASGAETPSARPSATDGESNPSPGSLPDTTIPVANAGFEIGSAGRSIPGWTPFGVGTYHTIGGGGHGGTLFAEVNNTGSPYQARLTSSMFPFPVGRDIEVSVWVKATRGEPTVVVSVNWYDQSGGRISSATVRTLHTQGSSAWQEAVGASKAPPAATSAEVLVWAATGNAAFGIDDVVVRAGHFIAGPPPPRGRPATLQQLIDNILSVFGPTSNRNLEGTKEFRLAWWGTIVDYTFFGKYFWTGKGFGINLADADGFQSTVDHSLRAPHNSHFTVLARMGVPGFVLWLVIQAAFGIGLLRAVRGYRRVGDLRLAAAGGWLFAYWVAMMVDTSFDPYLEGPQGGIWFWVVFGLGLVVIRLAPRRRAA